MSIKYYTQFLLQTGSNTCTKRYCGVVEVNRAVPSGHPKLVVSVLAKNLECDRKAIKVLHWSRLH